MLGIVINFAIPNFFDIFLRTFADFGNVLANVLIKNPLNLLAHV